MFRFQLLSGGWLYQFLIRDHSTATSNRRKHSPTWRFEALHLRPVPQFPIQRLSGASTPLYPRLHLATPLDKSPSHNVVHAQFALRKTILPLFRSNNRVAALLVQVDANLEGKT